MPVETRRDLARAYTPGVAEVCRAIAKDRDLAYRYTMKANTVAIVTDGSAVLGLGNIGGYVGPYLTGFIKAATGSFQLGYAYLACSLAVAGVLMLTLKKR